MEEESEKILAVSVRI